jgi:hypothetical protein
MKQLDLIIDALLYTQATPLNYGLWERVNEALAAARELRALKPVAWYAQDNLEIHNEIEVIWSSEKPAYAEAFIPLYALDEVTK